ncbi:MAG: hypothetical protein IKG21_12185 [Atopobiaceae bacterium]|nr:hypothetical protein [Atopobiaceae bacterium]
MHDQLWDVFVMYVNAYYAVQEAYDAARRNWERPAEGLKEFCRDANPFLWDTASSAEEEIYETFEQRFKQEYPKGVCTATDGRVFARAWLASLEGETYGTSLVASLDAIADDLAWEESCEPIAKQLAHRAARLERTPQDVPAPPEREREPEREQHPKSERESEPEQQPTFNPSLPQEPSPLQASSHTSEADAGTPSAANIEAVIKLLAKGDEDFAASLRARLATGEDGQ